MSGAAGGCSCGGARPSPCVHDNPPGLSRIELAPGRFGTFRAALMARIHREEVTLEDGWRGRPLAALASRSREDPSIAILDAWAAAGQVLAFYQDRIGQEGFLRTATEMRSVRWLAHAIGYTPFPGVAAQGHLAFAVEGPDPAFLSRVPAGLRVLSVPAPGEATQSFETDAEAEVCPAWSVLRARAGQPQPIRKGLQAVHLKGTATGLQPGDPILIVGRERREKAASNAWDQRFVQSVEADAANQRTVVWLDAPLGSLHPPEDPAVEEPRVFALRQRAALFGGNAPVWETLDPTFRKQILKAFPREAPDLDAAATPKAQAKKKAEQLRWKVKARKDDEWPGFDLFEWASVDKGGRLRPPQTVRIDLDAAYPRIVDESWLVLSVPFDIHRPAGDRGPYRELYRAKEVAAAAAAQFGLTAKTTRIRLDTTEKLEEFKSRRRDTLVLAGSDPLEFADEPFQQPVAGSAITVEGGIPPLPRGRVVLVSGRPFRARVAAGQGPLVLVSSTGKKAILESGDIADAIGVPDQAWGDAQEQAGTARKGRLDAPRGALLFRSDGHVEVLRRDDLPPVTLTAPGVAAAALAPGTALDVDGKMQERWTLRTAAGLVADVVVAPGTLQQLPAAVDPPPGMPPAKGLPPRTVERAVVEACAAFPAHATLTLARPLAGQYDPASVRVQANVVPATHGETVREVLGGGTARRPNQSFALRRGPLTHVRTPTDPSARPALTVRVGGVAWEPVATLHGQGPDSAAYAVGLDDEGRGSVTFGDGESGRRLPTSPANLLATYRVGLGPEGNLPPGRLTMLQERPLGLAGVDNPLSTEGGIGPEPLDAARRNAPLRVLTLDRVVSISDYEDFARAFGGIAKAKAEARLDGETLAVHLTVAPEDGRPLSDTEAGRLLAALRTFGNPDRPVRIHSYRRVAFWVEARLSTDPRRDPAAVQEAARAALGDAFSFERRGLGRGLAASEVLDALQGVEGVQGAVLLVLGAESGLEAGDHPHQARIVVARGGGPASAGGAALLVLDAAQTRVTAVPAVPA